MIAANGKRSGVLVVGVGGTLRERSTSRAALRRALAAAARAGAQTRLLDLGALALPIYNPDRSLPDHGEHAVRLVTALRAADALLLSTAAYQGTIAGVTKNALDFAEFLAGEDPPYLDGKVVGLIATAAGASAAPQAIAAMVHAAHALRAIVAPFAVPIPGAGRLLDAAGGIGAEPYGRRLDELGRMVVRLARQLHGDGEVERGSAAKPVHPLLPPIRPVVLVGDGESDPMTQ